MGQENKADLVIEKKPSVPGAATKAPEGFGLFLGQDVHTRAAQALFIIVILQYPLFSFPCRQGTCHSAVEVMAGQLAHGDFLPALALKALLYPGALRKTIEFKLTVDVRAPLLPSWGTLLEDYHLVDMRKPSQQYNKRMDVVSGSMFLVGGAVQGVMGMNKLGALGAVLTAWGFRDTWWTSRYGEELEGADPVEVHMFGFLAFFLAMTAVRLDLSKYRGTGGQQTRGWSKSSKDALSSAKTTSPSSANGNSRVKDRKKNR